MKQRVKNRSYLAKSTINLSDLEANKAYEAVALPANAEILHASLEVTLAGSGVADLGFKGGSGNEIANDIDLSKVGVNISGFVGTTKDITAITITSGVAQTKGEVILRVQYVLPSEILVEY